jgi:hypothetical protein
MQRFLAVAVMWGIVAFPVLAETSSQTSGPERIAAAESEKAPDKTMQEPAPRLVVEYTIETEGKSVDLPKLLANLQEAPGFKEGACSRIKTKKRNAASFRCEQPGCAVNQTFQDMVVPGVRVYSLSLFQCQPLCALKVCGGVGFGRCVRLGTLCRLCQ